MMHVEIVHAAVMNVVLCDVEEIRSDSGEKTKLAWTVVVDVQHVLDDEVEEFLIKLKN